MYRFTFNWYFVRKSLYINYIFIIITKPPPQIITLQKVDPVVYKNTILFVSGSYAWNLYNPPGVDGRKKFKLFNDERGNKGKTSRQFKMAVVYSVRDCIYNTCN